MIELKEKFVFHVPLHKYINNELITINQKVIDELFCLFEENGYENAYITKVKGYYKSRAFDELLITIFTSETSKKPMPHVIFKKWFVENNNILEQESLAYEYNNELFIEKL